MSALIIALDYTDKQAALSLIDTLDPKSCALKVGSEMFTLFGPAFIKNLVDKKFRVFLDLKFHDIPNTVAQACKAAADLGVWMVNVHASGGLDMMEAAHAALLGYGSQKPLLIAVTVLTSMHEDQLKSLGIAHTLSDQVLNLALLAKQAQLDGVVCSAWEAGILKNHCGQQFITVTPGIRITQDQKDDQTRIMTPSEAVANGSDYLVIGRPITKAADPMKVVLHICDILKQQ